MSGRIDHLLRNNQAFVAAHVVQDAWKVGRRPVIHGWVSDLATGFLRRHTGEINGSDAIDEVCKFHGAGSGAPT